MIKQPEKHYFECECGHSVMSVMHDEFDDWTDLVWITIYGEHTAGWKDRLRHIWSIIKYGHPWASTEIILRKESAEQLAELLLNDNTQQE